MNNINCIHFDNSKCNHPARQRWILTSHCKLISLNEKCNLQKPHSRPTILCPPPPLPHRTKRTGSFVYDSKINKNEILDQIEAIRTQNNQAWMNILRLAFSSAPDEAKTILKEIVDRDKQIVDNPGIPCPYCGAVNILNLTTAEEGMDK